MADENIAAKAHRPKQSGPKAAKKKKKDEGKEDKTDSGRNAKAFTFRSVVKAAKQFRRSKDIETKKHHVPVVDRTPLEPPPVVVAVVGPPKVGKTTLINSLLKNFTRQNLSNIEGPVTLVSGKKRRLTFIECGNDINSMIDIAKVADLVLLLIDASFGFEMEVFEFLNICQVHGFPKIMGVLTHLDMLKYNKSLKKIKKRLKDRFWTEVYQGAKLFYLSGLIHGSYPRVEIHNLGRFISVMKFRPLTWRTSHPYLLADRMEDLTDPESVRQNPKCDRRVSLYGYVRGAHLKYNSKVHLLGCGDFVLDDVSLLKDPCPLPDKEKKRSLNEREKMVYAPMSGVGGIVYDKDAVYIDLGGSHSARNQTELKTEEEPDDNRPGNELVLSLKDTKHTLDSKMASSQMTLFKDGTSVSMQEVEETNGKPSQQLVQSKDGRMRRKAVFEDDKDEDESDEDDADDQDEEESEPEEDEHMEEEDDEEWQEQKENDSDDDKDDDGDDEDDDDDKDYDDDDEDDDDDDEDDNYASGSESDDNSFQIFQKKMKKGLKRKSMDEEEYDSEEDKEDKGQNEINANQGQKSKGKELRNGDESTDVINKKQKKKMKGKMKEKLEDGEGSERKVKNASEKKKEKPRKSKTEKSFSKNKLSTMDTVDMDDGEISLKQSTGKTTGRKPKSVESDSESSQDSTDDDSDDVNDYDTDESNDDGDCIDQENDDDDDNDDVGYSSDSDQEIQDASSDSEVDFATDVERGKLKWKENLFQKASESFYKHQQTTPNLRKLVYGNNIKEAAKKDDAECNDDEETVGGFFKVKSKHQKTDDVMHQRDCSLEVSVSGMDWNLEEVCESIKDCFVTGKWNEDEDAEQLLNRDDELSDDEIFGDFEDLETGETCKASDGKSSGDTKPDMDEEEDSEDNQEKGNEKEESRMEKKKKLKAAFNANYDEGDEVSFYEELKTQMSEQSQLNQREFEDMDDATRVQYEGFRAGMYVRVELKSMPCEFVTNFDARYPVILGGVLSNEDSLGYVQIRVKKHRWFKRILKTRDPLILSIGWRRFQSMVMYSMQDHNGRHRLLKYTPEHLHCTGTMYGPIAPPTTGVLAVQSVAGSTADFRIAATGTVLALDKTVELVKKLKLTGTPYKIYKNTAFIKGMFNSALEVAKFEGASIRSVSGIRGQIKRALKSPEGAFRATFEDKLLISDILFVRTWYRVSIPKFYNPVTSLLLSNEAKASWKGMKTVGQLRKEQGVKPAIKQDSLYKPIERETRHFNPLVIPNKLQKELPFKSKPKNEKKRTKKTLDAKRAVVMEPAERKVHTLMQQLQTANKEKIRKRKEKMEGKRKLHRAEMAKLESKRQERRKEEKKKVFRMMAQAEKRKKRS